MKYIYTIVAFMLILSIAGCQSASPYSDAILDETILPTMTAETAVFSPAPIATGKPIIKTDETADDEVTAIPTLEPIPTPDIPESIVDDEADVTPVPTATPLPSPTPTSLPKKVETADLDKYDLGARYYRDYTSQQFYLDNHLGSLKTGLVESIANILYIEDNTVTFELYEYDDDKNLVRSDDVLRKYAVADDCRFYIQGSLYTLKQVNSSVYMEDIEEKLSDNNPVIICVLNDEIIRIETVISG